MKFLIIIKKFVFDLFMYIRAEDLKQNSHDRVLRQAEYVAVKSSAREILSILETLESE